MRVAPQPQAFRTPQQTAAASVDARAAALDAAAALARASGGEAIGGRAAPPSVAPEGAARPHRGAAQAGASPSTPAPRADRIAPRAAAAALLRDAATAFSALATAAGAERRGAEGGPAAPAGPGAPAAGGQAPAAHPLAAPVPGPAAEAPRKGAKAGPAALAALRGAAPAAAASEPQAANPAPRRRILLALCAAAGLAALLFAGPLAAQEVTIDLGGGSLTARLAQIFVLVTLLSLAPGLAIMITCFPFMVTVLSILRQAIGVQQAPPNMMIVSLALFLTYFVIEPVFQQSWTEGVQPLIDGEIEESEGIDRAFEPFRLFMEGRVDGDTLAVMAEASPRRDEIAAAERPPVSVLIPAFLLSEIQRGFEVGFLIFLPFLIIDLVIASVLMSMGMMMVPPAVVALPFKLAFFVIADGWTLLAGALVRGYAS